MYICNMINGQKEIWVKLNRNNYRGQSIIAVSNCGRIMRHNGKIEFSYYKQVINLDGKNLKLHRIIASIFIPKTENDILLKRNYVDHITHTPQNMNINDVRNMRWCTHHENDTFDEAIKNKRQKKYKTPRTKFGKLFIEKYRIAASENIVFYNRLRRYYKKYGVIL